ncbi:diguanylate cyclase (GGDEF)-like protein/PAS domain S-box-containing protein [Roseospira marina]|nr:diguanylate cyclase (GGDEF)-like protein/PAS domain S-box-containing protein [Roseospira marina]MBB5088989.1 diguanylate cyclase (GGDEF)-like protein/PAS domain S-box-containing protein [Roseospira marina]
MALALGLRLVIAPLDGGIQYITFFPSVAIAAVIGGFGPGMVAAGIGTVLATYLFWPPYMSWQVDFEREMILSNAVFLVDALLVCTSIEAMHRFYRRFSGAEEELRLAAAVYAHSSEGIMVTDADGHILTINPALSQITGYSPEELIGHNPGVLRSTRHDNEFYRTMWDALATHGVWRGQVWNRRKDGEAYLQSMTINRAADSANRRVRYVAVCRDITGRHLQDEQIRHLAFHDALTNLPNRLVLKDRLQHAIVRAQREKGRLALIFVDLDRFKDINDAYGHDIGDLLLQTVADRIRSQLRASDTAVRMGGDEFVILMENQGPGRMSDRVPAALIDRITQPMPLETVTVRVGVSLGLAFYPDDAADAQTLLKRADAAMYAAKTGGRNTFRYYAPPDEQAVPIADQRL